MSKSMAQKSAMSTYMAKKETLERKWYVIDAAGKPLGKTAVLAATILRGKHRPEYTPNVDCGEFVIIINAAEGCPHRQETRSEVLSSSFRLHRRSQGDKLSYSYGYQAGARNAARSQGNAHQEHPRRQADRKTQGLRRRRASAAGSEACRISGRIITKERNE